MEKSSKMSVEKIYQKKTQLEHILLRPDIWDFENEKMIKKEIKFVPGLFKIFDEILGRLLTDLRAYTILTMTFFFCFQSKCCWQQGARPGHDRVEGEYRQGDGHD